MVEENENKDKRQKANEIFEIILNVDPLTNLDNILVY